MASLIVGAIAGFVVAQFVWLFFPEWIFVLLMKIDAFIDRIGGAKC